MNWIIKKYISDKLFLSHRFNKIMNYKMDWHNPITYNQKLQWLKVYDHNPMYSSLVDKYEVKRIVAEAIGEEYIIPTIQLSDNFSDIDYLNLPDRFVMKCTHDSGSYSICSSKSDFDYDLAKDKIEKGLRNNFYWESREWPYKNVKPRVIVEEFIGFYPMDYKFFVFNGEIDSIMVCKDRDKGYPSFYFYDINWNRLFYQHKELENEDQVEKPKNLEQMIEIVEKLAKGFPHIRIDLYNVDGKIYFGEYTFFDQSGFDTDITYETDLMWGRKLKLPNKVL